MKTTTMMAAMALLVAGCANGVPQPVGPYSVAGTAEGVTGQGLMISDVGGSAIFLASDGKFILENGFVDGAAYELTAQGDPSAPKTRCTIVNGRGVIRASNVDGVAISCRPAAHSVGGTVEGVTGVGLILEANGAEAVAMSTNGTFTFMTTIATGSSYNVTIAQQPAGQTCTVANGNGEIGTDNVTNVLVTCVTETAAAVAPPAAEETASP